MIEIQDVTKTFHGLAAVNHVSLTIPEGEVFGLLGTNGAGKSTLLRMMAGILRQDSGSIYIDGKNTLNHEEVKKEFFYLSDKQYFFPTASSEAMGRFYKNLYPSFRYERYLQLLEEFGFDRFQKLRTFSKGMKKQAAILAAVCADVPYLFCDEVFDGLDPVIRQSVTALLEAERKRRQLTLVIASHNLKELEDFCGHIGILHKGGILLLRDIHSMQYKTHKLQCILDEESMSKMKNDNKTGINNSVSDKDIVLIKQEGFLTTILIRGQQEDIKTWIEQFHPEKYTFLPLTLEEIFVNETEAIGYDIKLLFS